MPAGATTAPDGAGGTYVVWASDRDGVGDIYLQRVTSSGTVASGWPAAGLAVCTAPGVQEEAGLISDGGSGVFVGWADFRAAAFNFLAPTANLYVQKVSAAGEPQWTTNGVLALANVSFDGGISAAPDGSGGVLFAWAQDSPTDIYAQHLNALGTVLWTSPGVVVCDATDDQYSPVVATDGAGGAYVAWEDVRAVPTEIYAQYLNAAGAPQWTANGVALTGGSAGYEPGICSDGAGGMLGFWLNNTDVIGQRYDATGAEQWTPGGESVGTSSYAAVGVQARADGSGGAYLVWRDPQANTTLYAQHVSNAGAQTWTSGGVAVCSATGDRYIEDGYVESGGGLTLLWQDSRAPFGVDLYAQKLNATGVPQWTTDGVLMCGDIQRESGFVISTDGAGGAVAAWVSRDNLDPEPQAQHVNSAGVVQLGANGTTVVADPGLQRYSVTAPDGAGGTWVVWHEKVAGDLQLRAKRLDSNGAALTGTVHVCDAPDVQYAYNVVPDGAGGVIIGWDDYRSGVDGSVYAQRISSTGVPLWPTDGVDICGVPAYQDQMRMISDGAGGIIAAWYDGRDDAGDIYAQRVNGSGVPQWTAGGVPVCQRPGWQGIPMVVPSGTNGAIVTWLDDNPPSRKYIMAQRLDGSGAPQWTADGVDIASPLGVYYSLAGAVSDGSDGAIVLYDEELYDPILEMFVASNPAMQRVDASGSPQWNGLLGVEICTVDGYRENMRLVSDGAGGAIAAWSDGRSDVFDIYAQRVDGSGGLHWNGEVGIPVCNATSWQHLTAIQADGAGGAVLSWTDERNGFPDVYAQRMNAAGAPQWTANGVQVAGAARGQYEASLSVDGGESMLAWTDFRNGAERLVYAQKLNSSGAAQWTTDGVTSALFSMVATEAAPGRVRVTWQVSGATDVVAYRKVDGGAWQSLGALSADGTGRVVLEDDAVAAGDRYAYRIGMQVDGAEVFSDEVWIEVPNTLALAIEGVRPQPVRRDAWMTFTLPSAAPARIEVMDVAGRRVASQELTGLGAGRHVVRLDELPADAGVYFVRVWQSGESVGSKVVRMR